MLRCFTDDAQGATPLHLVAHDALDQWMQEHPRHAGWVSSCGWRAEPGSFLPLASDDGAANGILASVADVEPTWALGALPLTVPEGRYRLAEAPDRQRRSGAAGLGWALGAYQFDRYKRARRAPGQLALQAGSDADEIERVARAVWLARDLINTPAEDLGPAELADTARQLSVEWGAQVRVIDGAALLAEFPSIHRVGRSSPRAPALIDLRWGDADAPRLTLIGKGVCFDTGGLDIKGHDGMFEMKKDMAGAAIVLGLAQALVGAGLRLRLRVLIPAVDNAISGNAMRPRDVIRTRSGKTVEIGFTDAEGRLVLCDALTEACAESADLVIDVATLTGSAKATLGSEVQALFTDDDALAAALVRCGVETGDALWRLPIWRAYRRRLDSPIADLSNVAKGLFADAIVATLFLSEFVPRAQRWAHLDVMGMNTTARPGRPEGGEATGLLALYRCLRERYAA